MVTNPAPRRRWRSRKPTPAGRPARTLQFKFAVLAAAILCAFTALSCQLFRLQVLNTGAYRLQADDNRLVVVASLPDRGLIYDRSGQVLARNAPSHTAVVVPAYLPRGREAETYSVLQSFLGVPAFEIEQQVNAARRRNDALSPITVKRDLDDAAALVLAERVRQGALPGVQVLAPPVRVYPFGDLTANLLGYIGRIEPEELSSATATGYRADERIGKAGVELTYEGVLRGEPGREQWEVDAGGRRIRKLAEDPPRAGSSLVLSVDAEFQRAVRDILQESVRDLKSKKAVALVMDVRTGELLADVSLPTYDDNLFSRQLDDAQYEALLSNPDKPLLDHAIAEKYAPGSTFKLVTALAALQEGVATPSTTIVSNGSLLVERESQKGKFDSFPDWRPGLGALSFYRAIALSSDIYFYCLAGGCDQLKGDGLGNARLARYARQFGFGERTGIDLPGETEGLIGDAEWLRKVTGGAQTWFKADTFYQGIGQGYVEATPMQVVRLTAAIANGGQLLRPHLVREIRDADGNVIQTVAPNITRRIPVNDEHLATVREAMRQAVASPDGTAARAAVPGVQVAGKTGTAEFGRRLGAGSVNGQYQEHGWFVGFAPFDNPQIAVVVFHDEGGGALTAAPTGGRIFKAWFDIARARQTAGSLPSTP